MPSLFQNTLAQTYANTSTAVTFHFASGTPIPLAPSLLQFLDAYYPPGSLTLRPTSTFDPQSFINALADGIDNNFRRQAHVDILNTYATAQVMLFGDTASRTFETYVRLLEQYPGRIACVYLRNLTAVDPAGSSPNPLTRLTREQAYAQVRQVLPEEMRGRVEQIVVPFVDPGELVGMNLTTTPVKCV
ncbi:hypothetical protein BCR44DRAFT_1423174 [Catenaria anguillulae PL171]|uniref:Phosphatidate phosphatase APP1 catalytic domain-containing protein n=1 Tax=Catenaria anguillulae PL171 TaxID=765915 RepID=A0A1Y2I7X1_9FUNG|nr:hypothetical protein BCR44DRAFT_1423174 [Catenaria anguillulae PL171]